jgi:hypothetical protein
MASKLFAEAQNVKNGASLFKDGPLIGGSVALEDIASRDFVMRMTSPPIEQVIPGAQLAVRYSVYRHHGIYAGGGRVIHYAGWIRGRRGLIEEVPLDEFTEGREFKVAVSPPDMMRGREVVTRARSRLGERCYDLLENNCEHFCTWCQLGEARSVQIDLMAKPLRLTIAAVQALWRLAAIPPRESSASPTRFQ